MKLEEWKHVSEIVKNILTVLAIVGAGWTWYHWTYERYDRAADILFSLEQRFDSKSIQHGARILDDDEEYADIKHLLTAYVENAKTTTPRTLPATSSSTDEMVYAIDDVLRFYVFLGSIRAAKQVPDAALSASYRYVLAEYYNPRRAEFRVYVDQFFPSLRQWLAEDARQHAANPRTGFFRPEEFNWPQ